MGYTNSKDRIYVLGNIPIVKEFKDFFREDIPRLPPRRNLDFTIELKPRVTPVSKSPFRMSVPELTELKMYLQGLLDKGYIRPNVSPWVGVRFHL